MSEVRIIRGDNRLTLPTLEPKKFYACVTSPPYWGLRNYDHKQQLGLEASPAAFIAAQVAVFRGVYRTLRDDGTLWLNMGDAYIRTRGDGCRKASEEEHTTTGSSDGAVARGSRPGSRAGARGLKPKDMLGMPWLLALALRAGFSTCQECGLELRTDLWPEWGGVQVCIDCLKAGRTHRIKQTEKGWHLRQDVIWSKPNPMPESVKDRCTKAHEYFFLFSKKPAYYFDRDAIAEPVSAAMLKQIQQGYKGESSNWFPESMAQNPSDPLRHGPGRGHAAALEVGERPERGQAQPDARGVPRQPRRVRMDPHQPDGRRGTAAPAGETAGRRHPTASAFLTRWNENTPNTPT